MSGKGTRPRRPSRTCRNETTARATATRTATTATPPTTTATASRRNQFIASRSHPLTPVPAILISRNSTSLESDSELLTGKVRTDDDRDDAHWSDESRGSPNRARTNGLTKGTRRRVTWLTSGEGRITDITARFGIKGDNDNGGEGEEGGNGDSDEKEENSASFGREVEMDLLSPDICFYQDLGEEDEDEEEKEEGGEKERKEQNKHARRKPTLPAIQKNSVLTRKQLKVKKKQRMSGASSPKPGRAGARKESYLAPTQKRDPRGGHLSERASLIRKEDTFIVTDLLNNNRDLSPNADLRRRKAMALAKANARHNILKSNSSSERQFYDRANEDHYNFSSRGNSASNKSKQQRAYIESTGAELKNDRGEKIYFHWKENEGTSKNNHVVSQRGPSALRRLYEYKKKRLKHKPSPTTLASKSAPNKNDSGEIREDVRHDKNRSKTADQGQEEGKKGKDDESQSNGPASKKAGVHNKAPVGLNRNPREAFVEEKKDNTSTVAEKSSRSQTHSRLVSNAEEKGRRQTISKATVETVHIDSDKENAKTKNTHVHFSKAGLSKSSGGPGNTVVSSAGEETGTIGKSPNVVHSQSKTGGSHPRRSPDHNDLPPKVPRGQPATSQVPGQHNRDVSSMTSNRQRNPENGERSVVNIDSLQAAPMATGVTQEMVKYGSKSTNHALPGPSDKNDTNHQDFKSSNRTGQQVTGSRGLISDGHQGVGKNVTDMAVSSHRSHELARVNGTNGQNRNIDSSSDVNNTDHGRGVRRPIANQNRGNDDDSRVSATDRTVASDNSNTRDNVIAAVNNQSGAPAGLSTQPNTGVTRNNSTTVGKTSAETNDECQSIATPLSVSHADKTSGEIKKQNSEQASFTSCKDISDTVIADGKQPHLPSGHTSQNGKKTDSEASKNSGNQTNENTNYVSNSEIVKNVNKDDVEKELNDKPQTEFSDKTKGSKDGHFTKSSENIGSTSSDNQGDSMTSRNRTSKTNPVKPTAAIENRSLKDEEGTAGRSEAQKSGVPCDNGLNRYLVNKPIGAGIGGVTKDPGNSVTQIQNSSMPSTSPSQQSEQGSKGDGLPHQEASVAMVTKEINKNSDTADDTGKHALRMNSSLSTIQSAQNHQPENAGQNKANLADGLQENSRHADSRKTDSYINGNSTFSEQVSKHNTEHGSFCNTANEGSNERLINDERAQQSIKDSGANPLFKLNLNALADGAEEISPPLSINRYNEDVLPPSKSGEDNGALPHSNQTLKDVPYTRSNNAAGHLQRTIGKETTRHDGRAETNGHEQEANNSLVNGEDFTSKLTADSVSKPLAKSGCGKKDEKAVNSIARSINSREIIHDENRSGGAEEERKNEINSLNNHTQTDGLRYGKKAQVSPKATGINNSTVNILKVNSEKSRTTEFPKQSIHGLGTRARSEDTWNGTVKTNDINVNSLVRQDQRTSNEKEQRSTFQGKPGKQNQRSFYTRSEKSQPVISRDVKPGGPPFPITRLNVKDQRKETKPVLSMHTQNIQLRDLPVKHSPLDASTLHHSYRQGGFVDSSRTQYQGWKSELPYHQNYNNNHNNNNYKSTMENKHAAKIQPNGGIGHNKMTTMPNLADNTQVNGAILQKPVLVRPKTAGLSEFAQYESEDLWSLNTGEEEDDQIQFIEGEQDFFKVFGYDEETAEILMATRVYPAPQTLTQAEYMSGKHRHHRQENPSKFIRNVSPGQNGHFNHGAISNVVNGSDVRDHKTDGVINGKHVGDNAISVTDQKKKAALRKTNEPSKDSKTFGKHNGDSLKDESHGNHGYTNMHRKQTNGEPPANHMKTTNGNDTVNSVIDTGGNSLHPHKNSEHYKRGVKVPVEKQNTNPTKVSGVHQNKLPVSKMAANQQSDTAEKDTPSGGSVGAAGGHSVPAIKFTQPTHRFQPQQPQPLSPSSTTAGTSTLVPQPRTRRRNHSEADIPSSNFDASFLDASSDSSDNVFSSPTAGTDPKALGKTQSFQTGHRNINMNYKTKEKARQTSSLNAINPPNQRHQESTDSRQTKPRDMARPPQSRAHEMSNKKETMVSSNPYTQAADRIMSRFSDTENSINSRNSNNSSSDLNASHGIPSKTGPATLNNNNTNNYNNSNNSPGTNLTQVHPQALSNVKKIAGSSSRRMSHPVDSRTTHAQPGTSFLASRPRKLKPIMQQPAVGQNQQFTSGMK